MLLVGLFILFVLSGIVLIQASECEEAGYFCVADSCAEGQERIEGLGCCQVDGSYVCCSGEAQVTAENSLVEEECSEGEECVTPGFFKKIIDWFRRLFGR